jgi:hypothetical protein
LGKTKLTADCFTTRKFAPIRKYKVFLIGNFSAQRFVPKAPNTKIKDSLSAGVKASPRIGFLTKLKV